MSYVKDGLERREIYSLQSVWVKYADMVESYNEQPGTYKTYLFKYKVKSYPGSQVDFVTCV